MSHSGTRIIAPIQILGDLQPVLGTTLKSVLQIIQQAPINKFAKCKPFPAIASSYAQPSDRLTAAKNAGYALTLPMYSVGIFASNNRYREAWGYRRPTGGIGVSPGRVLDFAFDGYEHSTSAWVLGNTATSLRAIFNTRLQIAGATMAAGDYVNLDMDCIDTGDTGLLYPYDFNGVQTTAYATDISQYYAGIVAIGAGPVAYVITAAEKVGTHHTGTDYATHIRASLPSALPNGGIQLVPVLCSAPNTSWGTAGTIIGLDGAYLSATKVSTSPNLKYTVTWSVTSSSVTVNITVTNQTGSAKNYYAYAYLLSGASDSNEHDDGYAGPDYRGEGAHGFLHRLSAAGTLPPKAGDIHSYDWNGGYQSPDQIAARFWGMQTSQISIANNQSKSYSHTYNYSGDDFGSYTSYPPVLIICAYEGGTSVARDFQRP